MIIREAKDIRPSEITPRAAYLNRRALIGAGAAMSLTGILPRAALADAPATAKSPLSTGETPTAREYVTSYNNYYEFGTDKGDPGQNAHTLTTKPWTVKLDLAFQLDTDLLEYVCLEGEKDASHMVGK